MSNEVRLNEISEDISRLAEVHRLLNHSNRDKKDELIVNTEKKLRALNDELTELAMEDERARLDAELPTLEDKLKAEDLVDKDGKVKLAAQL